MSGSGAFLKSDNVFEKVGQSLDWYVYTVIHMQTAV